MSRSSYSDDCENLGLYRRAVALAIGGKRGQAFLREMAAALDAMPVKELIAGEIVTHDGHACAIGAVALARGVDVSDLDVHNPTEIAERFGIARALAAEIEYENDEWGDRDKTPSERWTHMRAWVAEQLSEQSETTP